MRVTASWREGVSFAVATSSGHTIITDGPPDFGGVNAGARPMELLLAAVASCSASDVVVILEKGRHSFEAVEVEVSGERAKDAPRVFTEIKLIFRIDGADAGHARRAAELSVEKYCSALVMLAPSAEISWELAGSDADAAG